MKFKYLTSHVFRDTSPSLLKVALCTIGFNLHCFVAGF